MSTQLQAHVKRITQKIKTVLTGETKKHLLMTFTVYFLVSILMIATKVIISRFYGQEELGIYSYFFSVASFIFLCTSFGFPEALTKKLAQEPHNIKQYSQYTAYGMLIFTTIVSLASYFLFPIADVPYLNLSIMLFLISYSVYYFLYSIIRGDKQFALASSYTIVWRTSFIFCLLLFLNLEFWKFLMILSACLTIASIIQVPKVIDIWKKSTKSTPNNKSILSSKQFAYLACSLFLLQVGFYSLRTVDMYILERLLDFSQIGIYSAYASITNALRLVAYVFPVVILPMAATSTYKIKTSLQKIIPLLALFSLLILTATVVFIPLLYGPSYKGQFALATLMTLSSALLVLYSYLSSIFAGENTIGRFYTKLLLVDFIITIILNVGLNILFISRYGLIGAPLATIITIIAKLIILSWGIKKIRKQRKKNFKK